MLNNAEWVTLGQEVHSKQQVQYEICLGTREQSSLAGQSVEESWETILKDFAQENDLTQIRC